MTSGLVAVSELATTFPLKTRLRTMSFVTSAALATTSMDFVAASTVYGWSGPQSVALYAPVNVSLWFVCCARLTRTSTLPVTASTYCV